jgi:hypothetical protein
MLTDTQSGWNDFEAEAAVARNGTPGKSRPSRPIDEYAVS